ncbi:unnamed protein product [Heterotrigona itama]|uniref:Uncharacterized protein n=1 Tax=Heterotrigona itama TaxID=395501 RepID=A0A6V7H8N5_9HYME|nr:unnamed protein product [Heterotrigona itama]
MSDSSRLSKYTGKNMNLMNQRFRCQAHSHTSSNCNKKSVNLKTRQRISYARAHNFSKSNIFSTRNYQLDDIKATDQQDGSLSTKKKPRVLIAVHKDITTEDTLQPATSNIKVLTIKIKTTPKLTVGATYSPPPSPQSKYHLPLDLDSICRKEQDSTSSAKLQQIQNKPEINNHSRHRQRSTHPANSNIFETQRPKLQTINSPPQTLFSNTSSKIEINRRKFQKTGYLFHNLHRSFFSNLIRRSPKPNMAGQACKHQENGLHTLVDFQGCRHRKTQDI